MSLKSKVVSQNEESGIKRKVIEIIKTGKKMITLDEVKEYCRNKLDKDAKNSGGKYIVYGRNKYNDHGQIRDYYGTFIDEVDDYYENGDYNPDEYNQFYKIGIVITTPTKFF